MLVPLFSGLLAFSLVVATRQQIRRMGHVPGASVIAIAILAATAVISVLAVGAALHLILHDGAGFHELLDRMAEIIASAKAWLPTSIAALIPQTDALFDSVGAWLRSHAAELGSMSLAALKQFGYAAIGMFLGALIALHQRSEGDRGLGPVSTALTQQIRSLRLVFWRVATAQVKISGINTILSAIYLFVVLPSFGVHLPLAKTLTTLTFVTGLLPVVGNLLSNTAITVISVGYSLPVGLASFAFLVAIHKLEYFLNARIVGSQINARTWEILVVMVVFERIFGLRGVVVAPIFYAWLKSEWHLWDGPAKCSEIALQSVSRSTTAHEDVRESAESGGRL